MRSRTTHPNAEPGTGTQTATVATPPSNDDHPNVFRANGVTWKVGREYWDADLRDVVELTIVVRRSAWCDIREPEDCPATLVFVTRNGRIKIDPNDPTGDLEERFTLRRINDPAGVEGEVWS